MTLIVETGAVVPGADTYATVAELRAFAAKRGASLPANDPSGDTACEVLLIKACDYIQAQSERFKGELVQWNQPLCWPRYSVVVSGYELPSDQIPIDIKNAQCQLAIEAQTVDLMPTLDASKQTGPVTEKTVGPITKKFAEPSYQRTVTSFARVDGYLAKFYRAGLNQIKLVRA